MIDRNKRTRAICAKDLSVLVHLLYYRNISIASNMARFLKKPSVSILASVATIFLLFFFLHSTSNLQEPKPLEATSSSKERVKITEKVKLNKDEVIDTAGDLPFVDIPFMPKMANETLKAELGNASWKLFHTILARYPDDPTSLERTTLEQYIYLFAKVYPCGDCARHFAKLLKKYPPQLNSRQIAAVWGCHIHNKVNERLDKPIYDCSNILEDYDCGCGSDEKLYDDTKDHLKFDLKNEEKQLG